MDPRHDVVVHAVAVAWSVHPRGLLLQTRSSGVVGTSTQPTAIGAMVEQPGGANEKAMSCFSSLFLTIAISHLISASTQSTGRIFTRFSPFGSAMAVNDQSEHRFLIFQGTLP